MDLPTTAAPGVAEHAEALADTACDLADAAGTPQSWSAGAAEDAIEAMETIALALRNAHPDAAAVVFATGYNFSQLRKVLGLPPRDDEDATTSSTEEPVTPPTPINRPRARRGLGPGYQGVRIPERRTATGP